MSQPNNQVRISLQTKLLATIALILAVVLVGNSLANYYRASLTNQQMAELRLLNLYSTFENLAARSTLLFERQISQIDPDALLRKGKDAPRQVPDVFAGLLGLQMTTADGGILAQWQFSENIEFSKDARHEDALALVGAQQRPYSLIHCANRCLQSSYVPALTKAGQFVIIYAVRPLDEMLIDFQQSTTGEIALINARADAYNTKPIALASNAESSVPLIEEMQQLTGFLDGGRTHYRNTSRGTYIAQTFSVSRELADSSARVAILASDSQTVSFMRETLRTWLITGSIALLATIFLTYFALRTTLKKLVNLSRVIPMLSHSSYHELRKSIAPYTSKPGFVDEVDQLNFAVLDVASALEEMESSVSETRTALLAKIDELKETQDFNDVLVNDSPLVIVAHSPTGQIQMLNEYGRELSGWSDRDVELRNISQLILPDLSGRTISELLTSLVEGNEKRIQTEQLMVGTRNRVHDLTWMHAAVNTKGDPLILSVGLDITERRRSESRLRWLSKHDNVTDLLNREAFHEEASLLIQQYADTHRIDFVLLDIDKFAAINDMYGFQNGDVVLKETARFVERMISSDTIIARTGPNEFSALLINERAETTPNSDTINNPLMGRQLRFYSVLDQDAVEISLTGVIAHYPHDGHSIDELVSNTSAALRKLGPLEKGKINRMVESVDNRAMRQERIQIHDNIVKALSDERFILLYQPIYNVSEERITHCECLVRMRSENGHLVSPAGFMDIAKEHGLMSRLDLLVLRMALVQLSAWHKQGLDLKLSVNVTAATFESDLFIKELKSLILETGARADKLIFEIVETEAINNLSTAKELCDRLAELNVQIAFDDFGIGFTSFEYLRDLPVDYIKIDQSFIRYLYKRKSDQLLVKSMVDMAVALGKKVVAEGVEDDGSADILRSMGVHYLQGYFISRPRHVEELDLNFTMEIV